MEHFTKTMTRDAPILIVESWSYSYTDALPQMFGFPWPAPVFLYRNGVVESWRSITKFYEALPLLMQRWLKKPANRKKLLRAVQKYYAVIRRTTTHRVSSKNPASALQTLLDLQDDFVTGMLGLIPTYWIDEWNRMELDRGAPPLFDRRLLNSARKLRKETRLFADIVSVAYQYLQLLSQKTGLPLEALQVLRMSELRDVVLGKKRLNTSDVKKRQQGYCFYHNHLVIGRAFPKILRKHNIQLRVESIRFQGALIGKSAQLGFVQGTMVIIRRRVDLKKVRRGHIIVAPMTEPFFLPVMNLVKAIVTDEGGLMSHAAIIAREFHIPCIVGTKIATKVFKDGDRVEVDATKGVVTKL